MATAPGKPSKALVLVAAICVGIAWAIMLLFLIFIIGVVIALAAGMPSKMPISTRGLTLIFTIYGAFMVAGFGYFALALRIRCPHCGYKFLKNPKGLGPVGFVYNANCPRLPGVSPWAYQVGRFLKIRRIRCIKCGEEVFDGPSEV